ncbi:type III secretion system effector BopA family protein [Chromobacterium amazonense]|uniref:type III secretion system effector BopA family protein n=1 Tax=Chromobacterium amazonense TaxID=1382803 RepID=UPI003F792AEC
MSLTLHTAHLGNLGLGQRLRVDKSDTGADIKAGVREGLGGRVLSRLGPLPLLRHIGAVPSRLEQVRIKNREALQALATSLTQQYGESSIYANVETPEALSMIHCRGGVGRTGPLSVKPDASLERIVADERATRHHRMAEDQGPLDQGFGQVFVSQRCRTSCATPFERKASNWLGHDIGYNW